MNNLLTEALDLALAGFHVLPVEFDTGDIHHELGILPGRATRSVKQIEEWWSMYPDAGIAISTGEKAGIISINFERRYAYDTLLDLGDDSFSPGDALALGTQHIGRQYIFRYPAPFKIESKMLAPGISVSSEHDFIVIQGSPVTDIFENESGLENITNIPYPPERFIVNHLIGSNR